VHLPVWGRFRVTGLKGSVNSLLVRMGWALSCLDHRTQEQAILPAYGPAYAVGGRCGGGARQCELHHDRTRPGAAQGLCEEMAARARAILPGDEHSRVVRGGRCTTWVGKALSFSGGRGRDGGHLCTSLSDVSLKPYKWIGKMGHVLGVYPRASRLLKTSLRRTNCLFLGVLRFG
jgi:hypothetical protein